MERSAREQHDMMKGLEHGPVMSVEHVSKVTNGIWPFTWQAEDTAPWPGDTEVAD